MQRSEGMTQSGALYGWSMCWFVCFSWRWEIKDGNPVRDKADKKVKGYEDDRKINWELTWSDVHLLDYSDCCVGG